MKKILNKKIWTILKFAPSIGVLFILATKLHEFTKTQIVSLSIFSTLSIDSWLCLFIAFFLMPFNWAIETYKWHIAKCKFNRTPFADSLKQVLAGVSISLLTPSRNGEFIGRIALLPKKLRIKGLETHFALSLSQQLFTVLWGIISLTIIDLPFLRLGLFILALISTAIIFINKLIPKISTLFFHKIKLDFLNSIERKLLIQSVLLSGLRYFIFWIQYFLLLKGFKMKGDNFLIFMGIPSIFFIGSFIPSFALAEIGVKTLVAMYCFSSFSADSSPVIFASFLLWMINVSIPALIGIYPLLTLNSEK